jgi:hypothetical protein
MRSLSPTSLAAVHAIEHESLAASCSAPPPFAFIAGSAIPSNAASGKIANSPSPMNFRISPRCLGGPQWKTLIAANFG